MIWFQQIIEFLSGSWYGLIYLAITGLLAIGATIFSCAMAKRAICSPEQDHGLIARALSIGLGFLIFVPALTLAVLWPPICVSYVAVRFVAARKRKRKQMQHVQHLTERVLLLTGGFGGNEGVDPRESVKVIEYIENGCAFQILCPDLTGLTAFPDCLERSAEDALKGLELQLLDRERGVRYSKQGSSNEPSLSSWLEKNAAGRIWRLAASHDFIKMGSRLDSALRHRLTSAIEEIVANPLAPRGSTIRPLTGNHRGLWRYRIGEYRLLYVADVDDHRLDLVSFGSRQDVYK